MTITLHYSLHVQHFPTKTHHKSSPTHRYGCVDWHFSPPLRRYLVSLWNCCAQSCCCRCTSWCSVKDKGRKGKLRSTFKTIKTRQHIQTYCLKAIHDWKLEHQQIRWFVFLQVQHKHTATQFCTYVVGNILVNLSHVLWIKKTKFISSPKTNIESDDVSSL